MPQKSTAILMASSSVFSFALFVSLKSFLRNSPKLATSSDIFIYAYRWSPEVKNLFTDHFPVQIRDYDLPGLDAPCIRRFTPALFARFEAFELLTHYDSVVCLDSDILVQKELIHVLQANPGTVTLTHDNLPNVGSNFFQPIPGYDMSAKSYNAGFIVLRNPLPAQEIRSWLYQMLNKHASKLELGDQGLINLALQEFHLSLNPLPQLYNLAASAKRSQLDKAYIIHSTGPRKFWQYYYFDEWYHDYAFYRQKGGSHLTIRKNTKAWDKFLAVTGLKDKIFFELAPDFFRRPTKFLRFWFKYITRQKY